MTPKEEILKYLDIPENRRDYIEGINLLEKYGREKGVVSFLKRKIYPPKLYYKLEQLLLTKRIVERKVSPTKIISAKRINIISGKKEVKSKDFPEKFTAKDIDSLPEPLKQLNFEIIAKHKKIRSLHEKMKLAKSESTIAKYHNEITAFHKEIKESYAILDSFKKTGKLPETMIKEVAGIDAKAINSARKYISTNLPKLEVMLDEKKAAKVRESIKKRYLLLLEAKNEFAGETLAKLKKNGIIE